MIRPARRRPLGIAAAALLLFLLAVLLALAAMPVGWLRPEAERRLSAMVGARVTIGSLERQGGVSFHPTIVVRGLLVPQPGWAGPGALARVDRLAVTLPVLSLLRGRVEPSAIDVSGARIALVRAADGRENWRTGGGGGGRAPLDRLVVRNTVISYRDAMHGRDATVAVAADPARGIAARGSGHVAGTPVAITARSVPGAGGRWPFRVSLDGPALAMAATGWTTGPLGTGRMGLDVTARARDLKLIDAILEAGLFGTQPVRLSAHVEHDRERGRPRWRVTALSGTAGTGTRFSGQLTVVKAGDRSEISGALRAATLDFDDLASDAGLAEARARRAAIGDRLVPDTRIDVRNVARADGTLDVRVDRIVSREPTALRTLAGRLTMDHRRLLIDPLVIGLSEGAITGRASVDGRDPARPPLVRLDLRLTGSSVPAIAGGGRGTVTGRFDARALLTGRGTTVREAVGTATGRIGVVARDGGLPAQVADAIGFDAGRALFAGEDDRSALRCAVLGLDVRGGTGRVDPFVVDTGASRLDGEGTVSFPSEALAIRLTGAPKRGSLLRLPGAAFLRGTIERPDVVVPHEVKSVGNVLRAIGRTITGRQGPVATDADCAGLSARALR